MAGDTSLTTLFEFLNTVDFANEDFKQILSTTIEDFGKIRIQQHDIIVMKAMACMLKETDSVDTEKVFNFEKGNCSEVEINIRGKPCFKKFNTRFFNTYSSHECMDANCMFFNQPLNSIVIIDRFDIKLTIQEEIARRGLKPNEFFEFLRNISLVYWNLCKLNVNLYLYATILMVPLLKFFDENTAEDYVVTINYLGLEKLPDDLKDFSSVFPRKFRKTTNRFYVPSKNFNFTLYVKLMMLNISGKTVTVDQVRQMVEENLPNIVKDKRNWKRDVGRIMNLERYGTVNVSPNQYCVDMSCLHTFRSKLQNEKLLIDNRLTGDAFDEANLQVQIGFWILAKYEVATIIKNFCLLPKISSEDVIPVPRVPLVRRKRVKKAGNRNIPLVRPNPIRKINDSQTSSQDQNSV